MRYKIIYPQIGKRKYRKPRKPPNMVLITGSVAFIALFVITLWQGSLSWLLPGDPVVTQNALQTMVDRLRDGEGLGNAVATFCQEVVSGAR